MRRYPISTTLVVLGATLAAPTLATAMCTSDVDCKGDRICDLGKCKLPPGAAARQAKADARGGARPARATGRPFGRPSWFRGYGQQSLIISFHGWGGISDDNDRTPEIEADADFMPGTRLAGFYALSEAVHIGGYFSVMGGEVGFEIGGEVDVAVINLGFALKAGSRISSRVWLGLALDVGLALWDVDPGPWISDDYDTFVGFHFNPLFEVDVMLLAAGSFRLGVYGALGPMFTPIAASSFRGVDLTGWMINFAMSLGVIVGVGS